MSEISGNFVEGTSREEKLNHYHEEAWEEWLTQRFGCWLESNDTLDYVSVRKNNADFFIGDKDEYPDTFNDDHLKMISRSSVGYGHVFSVSDRGEKNFVNEINLHLPAAPEEIKSDIDERLGLDSFEEVAVYYGSGALGGMPAPEGLVTPHVVNTENIDFGLTKFLINRCINTYIEVYNEGQIAIVKR
jgi:hypothetical protein